MKCKELEEMAVKNVMEIVVKDVLKTNLQQFQLTCTCERCLDDVLAYALNHLPPRYIVNPDHQPYIRAVHEVNRDEAINVLRVVTQAATIISEQPRCESLQNE